MNKKQNIILVWILAWAGLFIAVLYSPIGSPDYYSSTGVYTVANQPVTLNNGKILNAPKANYTEAGNSNVLEIPEISAASKTIAGDGMYQSGSITSGGSSPGTMQNNSYQNNNSGSEGFSGGGSFIARGISRSSEGTSGIITTNGIATLSTTSDVSTAANRQGVKAGEPMSGGTDPGGDPITAPIPVGDGWEILLISGIAYVVIKMKYPLLKSR